MVMACLNINSLLAHIDELSIYISSRKIDILCINETKLDHTINDREVVYQVSKLSEEMEK